MEWRITVIPGDGIGPEITAQAVKALKRATQKQGPVLIFQEALAGGCAVDVYKRQDYGTLGKTEDKDMTGIERVKQYLSQYGAADRVLELGQSSATVELAAQALGCEPARIAKTLSFEAEQGCILIVAAGDAKIDNSKFKQRFQRKAKMLSPQAALEQTGYAVGGICPFGVPESAQVYLDQSLRRFQTVFPACGSANSAIELSCEELFEYAGAVEWVDVCKGWQEEA